MSLVFAALSLYLVACAPLQQVKPTVERTLTAAKDNQALYGAALQYADAQSWTVESSDPGLGWIEAVSTVDSGEGFSTRERWIISTRDGEIGIRLTMQYRKNNQWRDVDVVCDSYSYAREDLHLGAIAKLADTTTRVASNAEPAGR